MSGRHSGPQPARRLSSPALALGAVFLVAVVVTVILLQVGRHPAPGGRPAAAADRASRQASAGSASVTAAPSATASATAPASLPDPFGAATAAFLGGRSGTVLAAVYNLRTGQTWTTGSGAPQAEASIVKLDILETLLAQRAKSGAALSG